MGKISSATSIEQLAAVISHALSEAGISAVLSGGAVVSIYTRNEYESGDLDFISDDHFGKIKSVMTTLGFKPSGRSFAHPKSSLLVEFPPGPLAIGQLLLRKKDVATKKHKLGRILLLTPTQCVMDRLAAYFHWNDLQALDQALMVASKHPIAIGKIQVWAKTEQMEERFNNFKSLLKMQKAKR